MPYLNDTSGWSQTLEALADEHAQLQEDLSRCRCPKCKRFGVVSDTYDYYRIIYKCNCLPMFWIISLETGERIEEVNNDLYLSSSMSYSHNHLLLGKNKSKTI